MALGNFPPGPYSVTVVISATPTDIGLMEGAIHHNEKGFAQEVRASLYGDAVIEEITRGGEVFLILTIKEWKTASKYLMIAEGALGTRGKAGRLRTALVSQIVLTALAGTPAATEGPVTRTYALPVLAAGHNVDITLGPEERNVPLVFRIFPSASAGVLTYYTDT